MYLGGGLLVQAKFGYTSPANTVKIVWTIHCASYDRSVHLVDQPHYRLKFSPNASPGELYD